MNIAVLGGGSWGTTVASLTARNAPTLLWARNSDTVDEINTHHTNSRYLKEAKLYSDLQARYTIEETVKNADVVVMGIPSHSFRSVMEEAGQYISCLLYTSPSPRDS